MPDIKHSLLIDASTDRIYPLIASGKGFSKWWAADVTEDESSRTAELGFFDRSTIYRFQLVRTVVPAEIEWLCKSGKEWQDTRLLFRLVQNGPRTLLHFAHTGWKDETDYFISCNTTWGGLMFRLKAAAEGKSSGPLFSATGVSY